MDNSKTLKIVGIIILIVVLLAASVIAIFNGVVEIIEEVLGNIVGFLADPLKFINQVQQDAWNTMVSFSPFGPGRQL